MIALLIMEGSLKMGELIFQAAFWGVGQPEKLFMQRKRLA